MSSYGGMAALVKASLLPLLVAFAVAKPPGLGKAGAGDGLYKYSDKMQLLNNDSLEKYLLLSKTAWVIEFYSSWCGHCMNYAPTWKEFAQQIFEWRSVVRVGAIDCANDKNTPVCRAFQVMRYPTVRFFPPGMTSNKFLGVDVPSPAGIPNDKLRQKVADYVEEVRIKYNAKHFPDLVQLRDSQELPKPGKKMLVVVYEWEGDTDDIGREVALDASLFASDVDVVRAKATHPSYSKYKVMRTPAILFLDAEGSQVKILYGDQVSKMGFMDALKSLLPELNNDAPVVPGYNEVDFKPLQERVEENLVVVEEEEILANGKPRGAAYNTRVHMQDMTSAIRYSLSHEIALHSTISGEDYTNLRKFIAALAEFFPGPPPVTTKLGHLLAALDAVGGPGVITADQWLEMSKPVVAEIPVSGFVGCAGSSIKYRGYPCGLWTLFHAMTVEAVRVGQEARYGDVLDAVHGFVKSFFSCSYCSKHFQEMFAKTRQDVQDLESSVMWLWVSHNKVNKRLAGDISEDPAAPKIQFPPPQLCPDCFDDSSAKWVKDRVYDFLLSYYGRENIVTSSSSVDNLTVLHGVSSSSAAALKPPSRILFTVLDVTICSLMYLLSAGVLVAVYYFLIVARRHKRVSADPLLPKWVQFK